MKKTVVTCVTALLCVIAVCVSSVLGTNKLADAKVDRQNMLPLRRLQAVTADQR